MNWDNMAEAAAQPFGEHRSHDMRFVNGAKWMRDQLRTDEAVERVAVALFGDETELDWEYAAQWVQDDYNLFARRAINALLGEH